MMTFSKSVTFEASRGVFVLKKMPPVHQWIVDLLALTFGNEAIVIPLAENFGQKQIIAVLGVRQKGIALVIRDEIEGFDINHNPQLVLDWIKGIEDDRA